MYVSSPLGYTQNLKSIDWEPGFYLQNFSLSFHIVKNGKSNKTECWYWTASYIAYNICLICIKPPTKFEINPLLGNWDNGKQTTSKWWKDWRTDGQGDSNIHVPTTSSAGYNENNQTVEFQLWLFICYCTLLIDFHQNKTKIS